jgi:hypothetical protein
MNKKTNNGNSKIIKCISIYNPLKIQKEWHTLLQFLLAYACVET